MSTDILNRSDIESLSQEIGSENVPILLEIFITELDSYISNLPELQGHELIEYLTEVSHALKSSAASFGAAQLCQLAIMIDKKAKAQTLNDEQIEAARLLDCLKQTREVYRCWVQ
ncbi:phosphorelay protein LuxU [Vibrio azureus]|uniref:Phosphorelay protein LuxU n=1 Tax=Vibrio azureus NBRC 104587 TaxID=1219077 RepID=U3C6M5_9VIBR|nr:quorum-sensing phosphorelay protein LuxU [Vibrio azureus]AUI86502.1 phosphorelay protein LuxU [Vibrio azureus]GAD74118.1 phosphorelay protein LuxU [Vibrio azureus NBRC 104587]